MKFLFSFGVIATLASLLFLSCMDSSFQDPAIAFQEQWVKDTTSIGSYLRTNNVNALVDASGVRFVIDSLAAGFPPRISSTVKFKYTGRFLSGTVFDASTISGLVNSFVSGFQIGMLLIPEGSKARIYIPSGLAYGASGSGSIPANAIIMFEIQLLEVVKTETEKQRLAADTISIDQYLATNSIDAIHDQSGVRYVINELGTGALPGLYSKVKFKYTGKLISGGTEFISTTNEPTPDFDSRVINYIYGIQAVLPKLPVGTKATLYIPSGLGFGAQSISSGTVSIPANSNLIYEVELLDIVN